MPPSERLRKLFQVKQIKSNNDSEKLLSKLIHYTSTLPKPPITRSNPLLNPNTIAWICDLLLKPWAGKFVYTKKMTNGSEIMGILNWLAVFIIRMCYNKSTCKLGEKKQLDRLQLRFQPLNLSVLALHLECGSFYLKCCAYSNFCCKSLEGFRRAGS